MSSENLIASMNNLGRLGRTGAMKTMLAIAFLCCSTARADELLVVGSFDRYLKAERVMMDLATTTQLPFGVRELDARDGHRYEVVAGPFIDPAALTAASRELVGLGESLQVDNAGDARLVVPLKAQVVIAGFDREQQATGFALRLARQIGEPLMIEPVSAAGDRWYRVTTLPTSIVDAYPLLERVQQAVPDSYLLPTTLPLIASR